MQTGDSDSLGSQRTGRLLAPWLSVNQETAGPGGRPGDQSKYAEVTWPRTLSLVRKFLAILNSESKMPYSAARQQQGLISVIES